MKAAASRASGVPPPPAVPSTGGELFSVRRRPRCGAAVPCASGRGRFRVRVAGVPRASCVGRGPTYGGGARVLRGPSSPRSGFPAVRASSSRVSCRALAVRSPALGVCGEGRNPTRPVLKHGPRSLTRARVEGLERNPGGAMKVCGARAVGSRRPIRSAAGSGGAGSGASVVFLGSGGLVPPLSVGILASRLVSCRFGSNRRQAVRAPLVLARDTVGRDPRRRGRGEAHRRPVLRSPSGVSRRRRTEPQRTCWYPKDGELRPGRAKPGETLVEARSGSDVQIDRTTRA